MKQMILGETYIAKKYGFNTEEDIMNFIPAYIYNKVSDDIHSTIIIDVSVLLENNAQKKLYYSVDSGYIEGDKYNHEEKYNHEVLQIKKQISEIKNIKGLIFRFQMYGNTDEEIDVEELYLFPETKNCIMKWAIVGKYGCKKVIY